MEGFFFPFRPATVAQTWLLFAQALTGKHINTISCSTGSNPHTCAKSTNTRARTHTCTRTNTCCLIQVLRLTPNQVSVHWLPSVYLSRPEHRWIPQTHRQQKVVLTLTLCLCHNQSSSACVLLHVRFTHAADIAQIYSCLCFSLVLLVLRL